MLSNACHYVQLLSRKQSLRRLATLAVQVQITAIDCDLFTVLQSVR